MSNIVAIVGRPNVGKSTLFNRLTESRDAIVHESSGVTRDRHYGKTVWNGVEFSVDDIFEEEIRKQVMMAIQESDVLLFVVDATEGITHTDETVADMLRRGKKKTFVVANKVDNTMQQYQADVFYSLGLGDLYKISSMNGSGTGDLLDDVVKSFESTVLEEFPELPRIAVVGRPNVGKSTLINSLLGEERHIVTPIAGTTRDSVFTRYTKYGHDFFLVDTAGIRKKGKVTENLEFYSVMRSIRSIEYSDVCLLMLDATLGLESQDLSILDLIRRNNKGLVIIVNKWDLLEKNTNMARDYEKVIIEKIMPFKDVPVIFVSAMNKVRIHRVIETAMEVFNNRRQKIATSVLNEVMLKVIEDYPPPALKGKFIKIKFVTQLPTHAPSFAFFCNFPQYVKEPYKRYLENQIRQHFKFTGVPIQIFMRKK
jgi:GTP-binding protein